MEMAREERRRGEVPYGRRLAERMMVNGGKPGKFVVSELVRSVIAEVPETEDRLDLRPFVNKLNEEDIWSIVTRCQHVRHLMLAGWLGVSLKPLRSMSLAIGTELESVDLSDSPLSDQMLEVFATRLFSLQSLKLSGCHALGNIGIRTVSDVCFETLTSIDLSRCPRVDSETLGWIAGTLGHSRPGCKRLESLNVSDCPKVGDAGLKALAEGCTKLRFLNLSNCEAVGDAGVTALVKGCRKLQVLSLFTCTSITDNSLKAIGKRCKGLLSLNVGRCGGLTDVGVTGLARGCPKLSALNLAGSKAVSERGLGELASHCPALGTLNVTGCEEITLNGLKACVDGLGFVTEAKTFFGLVPTADAVPKKISAQQHMLETEAALAIQRTWSNLKLRRGAKAFAEHLRRDKAALRIQLCFGRYKRYMREVRRNQKRREEAAVGLMQRVWRGKQQRGLVAQSIAYSRWLEAQAPLWTRVQAAWRGYYVRLRDQDVARLLLDLYENRRQEALNAMCVFIQATVRRFLARMRAGAWFEVKYQRNRDRLAAVLRIQCCGRAYNALRRKLMMQIEKERIAALRNKAACRIQAFFRGMHGQYSALMKRQELERLQRLRNRKALDCQRAYRGFRGREIAEGLRFTRMREGKACVIIQRNWRMSRILPWRGIRMNKIAAFVFRREELELDERAAAVEERDRKRVEGAQHDSASDEEVEDVEGVWEEGWDDDEGVPFWYSPALNEKVYEKPPSKFQFHLELIGMNCKIFWPMEDTWFTAYIAAFNKTKRRHRINYPDGDHEWMNLEEEAERVMLEATDGTGWLMYNMYCPPSLAAQREKVKTLFEKRRKHFERLDTERFWVQVGWDDERKRMRWMNEKTAEIRFAVHDFDQWVEGTDKDGCQIWTHSLHGHIRTVDDDDPRWEPPEDNDQVKAAKERINQDLSLGLYLCTNLMQDYYNAPEQPDHDRRKVMEKILEGTALLKISTAISAARNAYSEAQFQENDMFTSGESVMHQFQELTAYGKWQREEIEAKRIAMLSIDKEKKIYHCPNCNYEVTRSDKYCKTCGEKVPRYIFTALATT